MDFVQAFLALAGACFAAAMIGGSFVFGVACVCRWLEWAPINTTININNYREADDYAVSSREKS